MKTSETKKLRVHRETLRVVSGAALVGVVGGSAWDFTRDDGGQTQPKSNAWTGAVGDDPLLAVISCSVAG